MIGIWQLFHLNWFDCSGTPIHIIFSYFGVFAGYENEPLSFTFAFIAK